MGTINPAIPTIGQPNSTEDADVRNGMITIRDEINGNLDNDNIKSAANIAGSKLAANSVAPSKLTNGTAGQLLIANSSGVVTSTTVTGDVTISDTGVTTIGSSVVGTTEIADDSITHAKMADNSVGNDEMRDAAVNTTELVDSAVTTAKVTNDAITADKLKDSASTDADRAVTTDHIRNSAIVKDKLYTSSINSSVYTETLLDGDTQYIHNHLSCPAGLWLINHNSVIRTGSSSNWDTLVIDINAGGAFQYIIDPVPSTTGTNERFSWGWSQVVTLSTASAIRVSYKLSGSPYPSGVYLLQSSLSGLCFRS